MANAKKQVPLWLSPKLYEKCKRAPASTETLLLFSYEGGDSEFINYLIYILQIKCVQTVSIL